MKETTQSVPSSSSWRFSLRYLFAITFVVGVSLGTWRLLHAGWGILTFALALVAYRACRNSVRVDFRLEHVSIFFFIWFGFTVLTFYILSGDAQNDAQYLLSTSLASVSGPLLGAISRDFQGCCLEFSVWLLPYCAAGLGLSALISLSPRPASLWLYILRLLVWTIGLCIWFGGGIVSFGHALS